MKTLAGGGFCQEVGSAKGGTAAGALRPHGKWSKWTEEERENFFAIHDEHPDNKVNFVRHCSPHLFKLVHFSI